MSTLQWQMGGRRVEWARKAHPVCLPHIMGVLNVTPDSFSDGGAFQSVEKACRHAVAMIDAGATFIDVGGESTRPGSEPVSVDEELKRVLPVIREIRIHTDAFISVDTTKALVAQKAIEAGAHIINDISALTEDPDMLGVAQQSDAGLLLMHKRGRPKDMQEGDLSSEDIVREVQDYLGARVGSLVEHGIDQGRIAIDPGIGFGKTVEQNLELMTSLNQFRALGHPVVLGVSRKSVLGAITGRPVGARLAASCAAHMYAALAGVHILRVHDVAETKDVIAVATALSPRDGGAA